MKCYKFINADERFSGLYGTCWMKSDDDDFSDMISGAEESDFQEISETEYKLETQDEKNV